MKIITTTSFIIICILSLHSCYYDNEAYLYGDTNCTDTTSTYTTRLAPIINNNCVRCHGPGSSPDLSTFTDVNSWKEEIVCRVVDGNSCSQGAAMPPSGSLSFCDIQAFSRWQQNGYQQ